MTILIEHIRSVKGGEGEDGESRLEVSATDQSKETGIHLISTYCTSSDTISHHFSTRLPHTLI